MNANTDVYFRESDDQSFAERVIRESMAEYFNKYEVEWTPERVSKYWGDHENYDIFYREEKVGVLRLAFDEEACIVRDMHVLPAYRNLGVGSQAIQRAFTAAWVRELPSVRLKTFVCNPSKNLYRRHGFALVDRKDNLILMEKKVD
ncbi:Histone acetyltransferase HPA2/related acetyltransferase [Hahella chejuensis KCTC 2396]|uniref:Histone acetyltransferase HPA2/related acetyltransferase n=1 Tax=Hahella chejuensis (strain KCTC 2396) TaxID=349521 RepID=Q2S878_HAHCH|nr:GNAT family N-acetyltransferase [Hahella chejuensis]ABC33146.1 Histone acetyltransferase HPA2/related acetyltransferase [Hahella chejuensis KCTC 2396]